MSERTSSVLKFQAVDTKIDSEWIKEIASEGSHYPRGKISVYLKKKTIHCYIKYGLRKRNASKIKNEE